MQHVLEEFWSEGHHIEHRRQAAAQGGLGTPAKTFGKVSNAVQVVGEPDTAVQHVLDEFGVYLKNATFSADVKPLLKEVCARVFGSAHAEPQHAL